MVAVYYCLGGGQVSGGFHGGLAGRLMQEKGSPDNKRDGRLTRRLNVGCMVVVEGL